MTDRIRFEDVPVFVPFFVGAQPYLKVSPTQYVGYRPDTWGDRFMPADTLVTLTELTPAEKWAGIEEARALFSANVKGQWCNRHREWTDSKESAKCWACIDEEDAVDESRARAIRAAVAAQWMHAITLLMTQDVAGDKRGLWLSAFTPQIFALPTPEQIVDGVTRD